MAFNDETFIVAIDKRQVLFLDMNDLFVEVKQGSVYANTYIFNYVSKSWIQLSEHDAVPDLIKKEAELSEDECYLPDFNFFEQQMRKEEVPEFKVNENVTSIDSSKLEEIDSKINRLLNLENKLEELTVPQGHDIENDEGEEALSLDSKDDNEETEKKVSDELDFESKLTDFDKVKLQLDQLMELLAFEENEAGIKREPYDKMVMKLRNLKIENDMLLKKYSKLKKKSMAKLDLLQQHIESMQSGVDNGVEGKVIEFETSEEDEEVIAAVAEIKKGKTFIFTNEPQWFVELESGVEGPIRYDQVLEYISNGTVNTETSVRKKGTNNWIQAENVLEFNAESTMVFEDRDHPENNRYRIERMEYRIDIEEIIRFEVNDEEFKGTLTDVSLSGAFVELTQVDKVLMEEDVHGVLHISETAFGEAFSCEFLIRRVSENKPRGIGISFDNLSNEAQIIIGKFIHSKVNDVERTAS